MKSNEARALPFNVDFRLREFRASHDAEAALCFLRELRMHAFELVAAGLLPRKYAVLIHRDVDLDDSCDAKTIVALGNMFAKVMPK